MFFMCCSVQGAKKGLWPGLDGILEMGAVKRLMQINSGGALCGGGLGAAPIAVKRTFLCEIDPAQIGEATR
jgi:hypothetical protein